MTARRVVPPYRSETAGHARERIVGTDAVSVSYPPFPILLCAADNRCIHGVPVEDNSGLCVRFAASGKVRKIFHRGHRINTLHSETKNVFFLAVTGLSVPHFSVVHIPEASRALPFPLPLRFALPVPPWGHRNTSRFLFGTS
jgi:hypothetical protein